MSIDIILIGILLLSAIYGFKQGMSKTLTSFMSWLACTIFGLIFSSNVEDYILQKTTMDKIVYNSILDKLRLGMGDQIIWYLGDGNQSAPLPSGDLNNYDNPIFSFFQDGKIQEIMDNLGIYHFFNGSKDNISDQIYGVAAQVITDVIISILAFIILVLAIKLASHLIMIIFSKQHHKGAIGFSDGALGFIFGILRGIIYISIAMAVLLPITALVAPDISGFILEQLSASQFANFFYRNNVVLALGKAFLL